MRHESCLTLLTKHLSSTSPHWPCDASRLDAGFRALISDPAGCDDLAEICRSAPHIPNCIADAIRHGSSMMEFVLLHCCSKRNRLQCKKVMQSHVTERRKPITMLQSKFSNTIEWLRSQTRPCIPHPLLNARYNIFRAQTVTATRNILHNTTDLHKFACTR